jgi:hypothetical protein
LRPFCQRWVLQNFDLLDFKYGGPATALKMLSYQVDSQYLHYYLFFKEGFQRKQN